MADERVLKTVESRELISDRLKIEGGRSLEGAVRLSGAKNLALQAIACSVLADGPLILENTPRIDDIRSSLTILRDMDAVIEWQAPNVLHCDTRQLGNREIDPAEVAKTTGSRYFTTVMTRRYGLVSTGPSGGDKLGGNGREGFSQETLDTYERIGLVHRPYEPRDGTKRYIFVPSPHSSGEMYLDERYFGPTVQAILFHAKGEVGKEFVIHNPCVEPEIFETIRLLNQMGADISYHLTNDRNGPDSTITVRSVARLAGTRFRIMSDPNVLVSYAVMTLITNGHVVIENIDPSDKVDVFLEILSRMNADYSYNMEERSLELLPSLARLKPVDLETNFWPPSVELDSTTGGKPALCHTDWQPILTPLLAKVYGESYIDENVHPRRFTAINSLRKMGANLELKCEPSRLKRQIFKKDKEADQPHTLKITGPCEFSPYSTRGSADIRGTTGLLAAMLSAQGVSILDGASQIQRGMEDVVNNLRSLDANVSVG